MLAGTTSFDDIVAQEFVIPTKPFSSPELQASDAPVPYSESDESVEPEDDESSSRRRRRREVDPTLTVKDIIDFCDKLFNTGAMYKYVSVSLIP